MATNKEAAMATTTTDIHKMGNFIKKFQGKEERHRSTGSDGTTKEKMELHCYVCGETSHVFSRCRYKNYTCRTCGKVGHLAKKWN